VDSFQSLEMVEIAATLLGQIPMEQALQAAV